MKNVFLILLAVGLAVSLVVIFYPSGQQEEEEEFPAEDIRFLLNTSVGGGYDTIGRLIVDIMNTEVLPEGVRASPENITGHGGKAGIIYLAEQPPDGYTFGFFYTDGAYTSQAIRGAEAEGYDLLSFEYITCLAGADWGIMVAADSPFETVEDLHQAETVKWGVLSMGDETFAGAVLTTEATGIPRSGFVSGFDGTADLVTSLIRGDFEAHIGAPEATFYKQMIDAGEIRVLAVMAEERVGTYPDVPTIQELGYPEVKLMPGIRAMLAPPGTPPDITQALYDIILEVAASDRWREYAEDQPSFFATPLPGPELKQMLTDAMEYADQNREVLLAALDEE